MFPFPFGVTSIINVCVSEIVEKGMGLEFALVLKVEVIWSDFHDFRVALVPIRILPVPCDCKQAHIGCYKR